MEKKTVFIIFGIVIALLFAGTIFSSIQSYQYRRLNNQLTERITDAENTNKRLAETVGQCQSICSELTESTDRSIRTAKDAIELLEEIRIQVQSLESVTGSFDWDSYYNDLDSYLQTE